MVIERRGVSDRKRPLARLKRKKAIGCPAKQVTRVEFVERRPRKIVGRLVVSVVVASALDACAVVHVERRRLGVVVGSLNLVH